MESAIRRQYAPGRSFADANRLSTPSKVAPSFRVMSDQIETDPRAALATLPTRGLADLLGIEIVELTPKRVVATMPVDERTRQPFGILHGGASVALAETVASLGAVMNVDLAQSSAVGLEINANHLRAKKTGVVRATATPIHVGRSTHVWEVRIVDEEERLVCMSRCTLAVVPRGS
jgi:1,4-dihydroxy-2-naphthoyl-CoA hydrolase